MSKTNSDKIKVLIADDHSMFMDGLKDILSGLNDIQVVGEARTGKESVQLTKSLEPDIVLMDINLPEMSGIQATETLKKECPKTKVLIISSYDDDAHIIESFRAGAAGYIPKYLHATQMIKSIYEAHKKGTAIHETILPKLLRGLKNLPSTLIRESANFQLTPMEIRVLESIKDGKQSKEAALTLKISEKTIRNHLSSIYLKLDVKSRSQAIALAINRGILSRD